MKKIRSFISINLADATIKAIESLQKRFRKLPLDVRWTYPSNIHLTLKFLGDIAKDDIVMISGSLYSISEGIQERASIF